MVDPKVELLESTLSNSNGARWNTAEFDEEENARSEKVLLTVAEAADRLGVGRSFLYGVIQRGDLVTVKLGRARRVPVNELDRYVERLRELQSSAAGDAAW
jgi:excisionase family DNA binding protein